MSRLVGNLTLLRDIYESRLILTGTLVNQFGFPVALEKIAWKTYAVFLIWCFVQAAIIYVLIPETKNRTVSPAFPLALQYADTDS